LQNQFAQNQVNAGQIAGNLQNTMAQNQITAGQNLGALQNQANANQVNAGQVAGNLLNTYGQNALTAGQTAGTLQNQFNTNQVTAGQAAANAAAQQASALTAAGTGQLNLGQQIQQSGLADVNALSLLGQQQQQIEQNKQLFPLDIAAKQAAIMSGAQIPTTTTQTMEGSPLSAIAGLGSLATGMFSSQPQYDPVTGKLIGSTTPFNNIVSGVGSMFGSTGTNSGKSSGILGGLSSLFGGSSNISGTPAANVPYTGQPSGSLTGNSTADQESNQYFDLPAGVRPDGQGGYLNTSGDKVDANGTFIPTTTGPSFDVEGSSNQFSGLGQDPNAMYPYLAQEAALNYGTNYGMNYAAANMGMNPEEYYG
jgi:hypothetical protein